MLWRNVLPLNKIVSMATTQLDTEFMECWLQLGVVEKESLLNVAKNYIHLREEGSDGDLTRKGMIQKEREAYLKEQGVSYSWQEVKEMAVNKQAAVWFIS